MNKPEDIRLILLSQEKTLDEKLKAVKRNAILSSPRETEAILVWIVEVYDNEKETKNKQIILETFDLILLNNGISILSYNIVSMLVKFIKVNGPDVQKCTFLKILIESILKLPAVKPYFKQNEKDLTDIFSVLIINLNISSDEGLISNLISYINVLANNEKAVSNFLKKSLHSVAVFCGKDSSKKPYQHFIEVTKTILFKKHVEQFRTCLQFCFDSTESRSPRHTALLKSLNSCLKSDLSEDSKMGIAELIFEAAVGTEEFSDLEILRLAILIAHMLGVNQQITFVEPTLNIENVSSIISDANELSIDNLKIWNTILEILGRRPINLSLEIAQQPALQWFRANAGAVLKDEEFSETHMATLTALLTIDSAIVEPFMSKIFKKIFNDEEKLLLFSYQSAYEQFLMASMKIFTRLQRINKLISRMLPGISCLSGSISVDKLLPASFLDALASSTTILPSAQSLNLIDILINHLNTCIDNYEAGLMNATLLQCIGILLSTILSSCRLLCYSLPRNVISSFIEHISRCKEILNRFGTTILSRKHDRLVMQTFMPICHVWGEVNTLVTLYGTEEVPSFTADTAPSDLSQTLPFLTGDQWSSITERVANFGDEQCNRLLMKLLVQKLRLAALAGHRSFIKCEATAKYLVERLKANLHGVRVTSVMSPEELSIVLSALPRDKAKNLAQMLYQARADDDAVSRWTKNSTLLENSQFVRHMFEVIIIESLKAVEPDSESVTLKNLHFELNKVAVGGLFELQDFSALSNKLNEAFSLDEKFDISANHLASFAMLGYFPYEHIVKHCSSALTLVTAMMVLFNHETLLPIFERILILTKTPETCFNIGLCVAWLLKNVASKSIRGPIIEQIVVRSTSSPVGMKQFKSFVKTLKSDTSSTDNVEALVIVHNAIRKCWRSGSDAATVKLNDSIAKQRRKLNKGLHSILESAAERGASDWVLLDAYALELFRVEREGKVDALVALNFDVYLKKALAGLKEGSESEHSQVCLNFITTVLKCCSALRKATSNENLVHSIWQQLKAANCPSLWQHFCAAASDDEFTKIIHDVLLNVQAGLVPPDHEQIKWENNALYCNAFRPMFIKLTENKPTGAGVWHDQYLHMWRLFLQNSKEAKLKISCDAVSKLITKPRALIPNSTSSASLLNWLKFLHYVASHRSIPIRTELEDYIFDVILAVPCAGKPFFDLFSVQVDILGALIALRKVPILRKVPLIFQAFQRLLHWLLKEGDANVELSPNDISSVALAAFHLEKWVGLFVRRREEFRVNPLFLTEIIHSLGNITVYPPVKLHLNNMVFSILSVSDEHTVKFLLRTLPPGCQQVFTSLHAEFQRFYKYKGKI